MGAYWGGGGGPGLIPQLAGPSIPPDDPDQILRGLLGRAGGAPANLWSGSAAQPQASLPSAFDVGRFFAGQPQPPSGLGEASLGTLGQLFNLFIGGPVSGAVDVLSGRLQPGTPEATQAAMAASGLIPGGSIGRGGLGAGPRLPRKLPEPVPEPTPSSILRPDTGLVMPDTGLVMPQQLVGPSSPVLPRVNIGMGSEAPLFDLSRLAEQPNVPQFPLWRAPLPARGIPPYVLNLGSAENMQRVREAVQRGLQYGGTEWYNTMPLLEGWQGELGRDLGQQAYERYFNLMGPTSQQTRVPENIRNASYLNSLIMSGEGLPPPGSTLPYPYGMMGQTLENARSMLESGYPLSQPKTASFSQNLMGNYEPYTFDTHMARLYGLVNEAGKPIDRPNPGWYSFLEGLGQTQAEEMGLTPAAHQAGGWLAVEGLRSPREPFMSTFEARVRHTAQQRGETPQQTLTNFYRGVPLLSLPGVPGLGGAVPDNQ